MPLILRLSIIQSTMGWNISYDNKTHHKLPFDCIVSQSGSWCPLLFYLEYEVVSFSAASNKYIRSRYLTSLVRKMITLTVYIVHCALCAYFRHGPISSMVLCESVYSFPCCVCGVRLLNAWLNILHGCDQSTTLSLVLHALYTCFYALLNI